MYTKIFKYFLIGMFLLINIGFSWAQEGNKPNIIFIVADDLGYSDLGAYGGEVKTPTLDKMAKEGVRLSNMHNASMCVLSRSSLLSGKWWNVAGQGIVKGNNLAQELQKVGYRTGVVGKWHLKGEPNDKGFDYFFGFLSGFSNYYNGSKDYRLNKEPYTNFGENYYSTDEFSKRAIEFIDPAKNDKKPFFLYLSYQAPHNPLQAPKDEIMKYRGKYLKGWQAIRDARIKNQIKFGIVKPGTPLPQYPQNLPDWETLTPAQKDLEDLRMSVYAAMVDRMDQGIGKLMKALDANGQKDNTFIIFLSDNGTDPFSSADAAGLNKGLLPGDDGSNFQPGMGWAYASVAPWRQYKIAQHQGGVTTGAIAWYPKLIKNSGSIRSELLHVVDIMPTVLDLAMSEKMVKQKNQLKSSLSGESFITLLKGENWLRKSPAYFQFVDNRAIRTNEYSLVEVDGSGWELYDVTKDPLETTDLSYKLPKVVKNLEEDWFNWWRSENKTGIYAPQKAGAGGHYSPQGDRGTGKQYIPSAMPEELKYKYKKP